MKWKIELETKKLDKLYTKVEETSDEETQAYLAKFLCVRTSGYLETCVKNLVASYLSGAVPKSVERYVLNEIKNLTNLTDDKIVNFLNRFNPEWADEFENRLTDKKISSLRAVVSNRHLIAHGNTDNISFRLMKTYYLDIKSIASDLEEIITK